MGRRIGIRFDLIGCLMLIAVIMLFFLLTGCPVSPQAAYAQTDKCKYVTDVGTTGDELYECVFNDIVCYYVNDEEPALSCVR